MNTPMHIAPETDPDAEFSPHLIELEDGYWRPAIIDKTGKIMEEGEYDYSPGERSAGWAEAKYMYKIFMEGKM